MKLKIAATFAFVGVFLLGTVFVKIVQGSKEISWQPKTQTVSPVPTPIPIKFADGETLWKKVQAWRVSTGKAPYLRDEKLCVLARERVVEIQTNFSHTMFALRFNGEKNTWDKNYREYHYLAENLSEGFNNEDRILNRWLDSPPHRESLDKPFTNSCIKCGLNYCVQIFGKY